MPKRLAISAVEPCENAVLRVQFNNGKSVLYDFKPYIERIGKIYEPLAEPTFFRRFTIDRLGYYIEWENGMDVCADTLWAEGRKI
ncbi:MAG: DUF2442 domain-containing protein [Candidatus Kapabacteria bacterium]|jgi:hypothetical protein|nr:DUF2442 domain-containing protein [Candidatus Kapabacteria bacterium]